MERMMSMVFLSQQERSSVSDALLPSRNVGIVLNGTALGQRMAWAGGVFNDWFDAGQSLDESATQLVGRVTGLPVLAEDESYLIHLGFGMRYSDAKEGVRARTEPEFNKSPLFVDTEPLEADSAMTYVLETAWRSGPLWVGGEYVRSDVRAPALGDPSFGGFHVSATWSITGEMRAYQKRGGVMGPMPVSRSVNQGGWGAWELGARWSDLDLSDGPVEGGEMRIFSLGVNWWLSPRFNVNFNYRHIVLDRFGVRGTAHGLNGRVLLILE